MAKAKKKQREGTIKIILRSVRQYKKPSILSILFVSLEVVAECFIPLLMSYLLDEMNSGQLSGVWKYAVSLVALAFFSLACGILAGRACAVASAGLAKNLTRDMFAKITGYSFKNVDDFSSSSLVTRMTTDVNNVQMAYMMIVRTAVRAPFMLVFSATMAFIMSPRLAWIFVVVIPFLVTALGLIIYKSFPRFKRVFREYDAVNESVQENVAGIRTVKSYVREDYEKAKFKQASDKLKTNFTKAERIVALNNPLMNFSIYTLNVVIIFVGALLIVKTSHLGADGAPVWGALSVGRLSSLLTYGIQSLMSLMMLSMIVVMIALSIESARRIREVLTTSSDIVSPENAVTEVEDGSVEFKDVSFKYNAHAAKPALADISLRIESGETVGILGATGAGKTTLVNLISRLYDATSGEVTVGGRNVKEYDLDVLRTAVAVVLQKNLLFSGTIRENLQWGKADATDEELTEAAKAACALEFINGFKDGFDTHIEQGGANVSGGQKQRLCIARALLRNPKVLVLDDSTSAVDMKTDAMIRAALKSVPATKIIIAQRVSSVQDSDKIVILDGGRISAVGTHEELLQSSEIYREIYTIQNASGGGENHEKE